LRIDGHFGVHVPYARPISPITKTDRKGRASRPTSSVPVEQALDVAKRVATEAIRQK